MAKVRCEVCNQAFKDEHGLAQHNAAKHAVAPKQYQSSTKYFKKLVISIAVLVLVVAFLWWAVSGMLQESSQCKNTRAIEQNIGSHQNLAQHIHADLRIVIDGKEQAIPSDIGIVPGIMRPVHTHDASGEVHIEGPCRREYSLGEFFEVWGKQFSERCIFEKCTDKGELTMTVDGKDSKEFDSHMVHDDETIVITYTSAANG